MEEPTRCNNNNLLISKISSTYFGQSFAYLQERKTEIFTAYGIVSCCCVRQGFGEGQRGTLPLSEPLHNGYYVCVTFRSRTHNNLYAATSPRLTFKNFKLSDFLKFSDFNEARTNSLMMIY